MEIFSKHSEKIRDICKHFRVRELHLFGSALNTSFGSESDVDLLVSFERRGYEGSFQQYMGFKTSLENLFGRSVDLVSANHIRNPVFKDEVERTKKLIYAAQS